jgi:hypothetical protein
MTTLREAVQQALVHVQEFKRRWMAVPPFGNKVNKATREAVSLAHMPVLQLEEALRAALAEEALQRLTNVHQEIEAALEQPEQPVAWRFKKLVNQDFETDWVLTKYEPPNGVNVVAIEPLFTHPPRCPNCASLEAQNAEQDRVLVEMEHALNEADAIMEEVDEETADAWRKRWGRLWGRTV